MIQNDLYSLENLFSIRLEETNWHRENSNSLSVDLQLPIGSQLQEIQTTIYQSIEKIKKEKNNFDFDPNLKDWENDSLTLSKLYKHLKSQDHKNPKRLLWKFCEAVYNTALEENNCTAAWEIISKVVFLAERIPGKLAASIDPHPEKIKGSIEFINDKIKEEFHKIVNEILQKDSQNLYLETSKEITKFLLSPEGIINFGLIETINAHFLPIFLLGSTSLIWPDKMKTLLNHLRSPLQTIIDKVECPNQSATTLHKMVCADLDLPLNTILTKLHCQQEVFIGLFNLLEVDTFHQSFNVAMLIKRGDRFLQNASEDYLNLVNNGYLLRRIHGKEEPFFFEDSLLDCDLQDPFPIYILSAWNNALIVASKTDRGDPLRKKILQAIMRAFKPVFISDREFNSLYHQTLIKEIKKTFKQTINDCMSLCLHSCIAYKNQYISKFKLYQKNFTDIPQKGTPITSSKEFILWIEKTLNITQEKIQVRDSLQEDQKIQESVIEDLHKYNHQKTLWEDLKKTILNLHCDKPWSCTAVEIEQDFCPFYKTIKPHHPKELLKWLLDVAQWNSELRKKIFLPLQKSNPVLQLESKALKNFLQSSLSPSLWIEQYTLFSGKEVADAPVTSEEVLCFKGRIINWISQYAQEGLSKSTQEKIDLFFNALCSRKVTVRQFGERSFSMLFSLCNLNIKQKTQAQQIWDGILLQSLSEKNRMQLTNYCIRFIKYKIDSDKKMCHLCFFFNPRKEEIEFGLITENESETELFPLGPFYKIE